MHPFVGGQNLMGGPLWMEQNQTNAVPQMQPVVPPTVPNAPTVNIRPRGPPKQPRQLKEGDWECPEPACGNINFSKRTKCNRCGIPRPRPPVDPLQSVGHFGGPPGLFKQGDWPCPHCGNVNWARRDKCNICNAPKPSIKAEPRTGRGGGHFDLQDPTDRNEHQSDDEEYDEFGRKKKRKKKKEDGVNCHSALVTEKTEKKNQLGGEPEVKMAFPPVPKQYENKSERSLSSCSDSSSSSSSSSSSLRSESRSNSLKRRRNENFRRNEKEKNKRRSRSRTTSRSRSRGRYC